MPAAARLKIERERDERREFAAACRQRIDRAGEECDVRTLEASARTAEREAARLDELVSA
jgi:hypothetical protein